MPDDPSDNIDIQFGLFHDERDLIVEHALALDAGLARKLLFGEVHGPFLVYTFSVEDFEELLDALAAEANHARTQTLRRQFAEIYERLSAPPRPPAHDEDANGPKSPLQAEVDALIEEAVKEGGEHVDMDKLNQKLEALSEKYNHTPVPEFDGLSPAQVARLLYVEWGKPESAIVLNEDLSFADVQHAEFLANARILMSAVADAGDAGVKATSSGRFNRAFVAELMHAITLAPDLLDTISKYYKVVDEDRIFPLHVLRIVLGLAGMIRARNGHFTCTRKGKALLPESAAGKLFAALFKTFFRKFKLSYLDRMVECPELQDSVPYSLCVLQRHADDWQKSDTFAPQILLPAVRESVNPGSYVDLRRIIADTRILYPLCRFGLIEFSVNEGPEHSTFEARQFRKTPVFDRFLTFRLDDSWPPREP